MSGTADILSAELPGVAVEIPLAPYCAYGVGGPAEYLYEAHKTEQLRHAVVVARQLGVATTVLGRATNVLVSDRGVRGLVVLARNADTRLDGELLTAGAGVVLPDLAKRLAGLGLAGLEFAGNIPGSVGGAIIGNAGAYGREIGDVLVNVRLLAGDEETTAAPRDLALGYRMSALKNNRDVVVLEARFALAGGDRATLLAGIERDAELRHTKHPLEYGSCGSFFKNPSREVPAAKLIDDAGLKGLRVGRAEVSAKHANFLIALPGAGAEDIRRLATEVARRVFEASGVRLEQEVCLLGFD